MSFLCDNVKSAQIALRNFTETKESEEPPAGWEIWGVGLLMVTITAFASSIGILFMPYLSRKYYSRALTVLSGMGVGGLTGTILFVMIPETFHLKELGSHDFALKGGMMAIGIYLLFFIDKLLKFYIEFRRTEESTTPLGKMVEQLAGEKSRRGRAESIREKPSDEEIAMQSLSADKKRRGFLTRTMTIAEKAEDDESAHMVLFGNLVINLVDGLTMGTAFGEGLIRGLSVSAAIIVTQFPQEIADLAILINLGIGVKQALLWNLIPAALSYLGFIGGVLLEHTEHFVSDAVFTIAAGMYLFIVLSALIPEMNEKVLKEIKQNRREGVITAILQIASIIFGLGFLFGMSIYSGDITLEF